MLTETTTKTVIRYLPVWVSQDHIEEIRHALVLSASAAKEDESIDIRKVWELLGLFEDVVDHAEETAFRSIVAKVAALKAAS